MSHAGNARLVRRTKIALTVMVLTSPLVIWGTVRGLNELNDDALSWTTSDLPARQDLAWFEKHFGSRNSILVSWPGATIDDPRLERFARALISTSHGGGPSERLFEEVVTGPEVLEKLTSEPLNCSQGQAINRLRGMFVGPDGRTSCAVVLLSEDTTATGRRVVQTIREVADKACGIEADELRMAGYVVETAALDTAAMNTLYSLSLPSALLVILIAWPCLRNLRLAMLVWLAATFCQCLGLSIAYYHCGRINGMLTILPILLMVIFVSSAVHLINYYQEALREVGPVAAPMRALAGGWFPCSLAILTSAIGVGSLVLSKTPPVRSFGGYASVTMLLALAVLLSVIPGGMSLTSNHNHRSREKCPKDRDDRHFFHRFGPCWSWAPLARFVHRHSTLILFLCLAATTLGVCGLTRLKESMQLTDFFAPTSRTNKDHRWLQENLGPLFPVEIVLVIDDGSQLSTLERAQLVRRIEQAIHSMPMPVGTVSLAVGRILFPRRKQVGVSS